MTLYKKRILIFFFFFSCCNSGEGVLAFNKSVVKGELKNGLTYYLQNQTDTLANVRFRLIIKAGSLDETNDQKGVAHLVEHLCFRGTDDFPNDSIDHYLRSIGTLLGKDLNAYTGFHQTIFDINIRQNDSASIEKCVHILSQWAHAASIDNASVFSEKKIIEDEKDRDKQKQGLPDTVISALLGDSRYIQRLPIGSDTGFTNLSLQAIRSFYQQWYRPDLTGVVVVGDLTSNMYKS